MNQTQFEKLRDDTSKLVTKIQSLRDQTGKPGTLKDFQSFDQVERLGNLLWEHGLKTTYVSDLLKEINYLKKEKNWSTVQSKLSSLSRKLHPYASQHETVSNLKKVLYAAISKIKEQSFTEDFEVLIKLIYTMTDIIKKILRSIQKKEDCITRRESLKEYPIRHLINDTEQFGQFINFNGLKTNQIRKFLDAVNNLKLSIEQKKKERKTDAALLIRDYPKIDAELVLLKQKIAYASARQDSVKPLKEVMDAAIDKVNDSEDFERFFQLIESIIAYHKAAGGKD
jgi:CRISPR-associated protein Csm2